MRPRQSRQALARLVREEAGQDLIEYALLAAFISLVATSAIAGVGTGVNNVWGNVDTRMAAAAASAS